MGQSSSDDLLSTMEALHQQACDADDRCQRRFDTAVRLHIGPLLLYIAVVAVPVVAGILFLSDNSGWDAPASVSPRREPIDSSLMDSQPVESEMLKAHYDLGKTKANLENNRDILAQRIERQNLLDQKLRTAKAAPQALHARELETEVSSADRDVARARAKVEQSLEAHARCEKNLLALQDRASKLPVERRRTQPAFEPAETLSASNRGNWLNLAIALSLFLLAFFPARELFWDSAAKVRQAAVLLEESMVRRREIKEKILRYREADALKNDRNRRLVDDVKRLYRIICEFCFLATKFGDSTQWQPITSKLMPAVDRIMMRQSKPLTATFSDSR